MEGGEFAIYTPAFYRLNIRIIIAKARVVAQEKLTRVNSGFTWLYIILISTDRYLMTGLGHSFISTACNILYQQS